jgi:hypothetical protein
MVGVDGVLMAVALEGAKPLAVAGAFAAFRAWSLMRGLSLALLAIAAVAFSLTSELALIAGNRGDMTARRASVVEQSDARRARMQAAQSELAALAPSRPAADVQADITKLLADNPKAGDCQIMDGPVSRAVCPQVAVLNGEIARTQRRIELQTVIERLTDALVVNGAVKVADPASSALSIYLAALFGVTVSTDTIAQWLTLVPVLALELGAALAAVLVEAVGGKTDTGAIDARPLIEAGDRRETHDHGHGDRLNGGSRPAIGKPNRRPSIEVADRKPASKPGVAQDGRRLTAQDKVAQTIVSHLKANGGSLSHAQRGLARRLRASRRTLQRAINALAAAGVLAVEATHSGTLLRLC